VAGLQAIATARRLERLSPRTICGRQPRNKFRVWEADSSSCRLKQKTRRTQAGTQTQDEDFYRRQRELLVRCCESDVVVTAPWSGKEISSAWSRENGCRDGPVRSSSIWRRSAVETANYEGRRIIVEHSVTIAAYSIWPPPCPPREPDVCKEYHCIPGVHWVKEGKLQLNLEDEIIQNTLVTQEEKWINPRSGIFSLPPLVTAQKETR